MKRIGFLGVLIVPLVGLFLISYIPRASGSPGAKTGSPGDTKADCTGCHASQVKVKTGWITSTIPEEGYVPGESYTITLSTEYAGVKKMGFELTAEHGTNTKTGGLDPDGNSEIKFVNNNQAITHTSSGITPTGDSKVWTMKWVAPAAGTGDVTFYAAVNAANGNSSTSGDQIFTTETTVIEQIDNSIDQILLEGWVRVYPNPANHAVKIRVNGMVGAQLDCRFFNLAGQLIDSRVVETNSHTRIITLPVDHLPDGAYLLYLDNETIQLKGKVLIVH